MAKVLATPGVYIEEKSAFLNSAVPVATAVPAFLGYTEKAIWNNKDITNTPTRISSFGEYLLYFGGAPKTTYSFENVRTTDPKQIYKLEPKDKRFLLFHCMKHFFANGGSDCYIVSIGNYDAKMTIDDFDSEAVDANGESKQKGLKTLLKETEPTMVVAPDAVLLEASTFADLQTRILNHCGAIMRSRIAILDVYDGYKARSLDPQSDVITKFREGLQGNANLQWGAAYYPWVHTNITSADAVNFTNIDAVQRAVLGKTLLEDVDAAVAEQTMDPKRADQIKVEVAKLTPDLTDPDGISNLHQTLWAISPLYKSIMDTLREQMNLLPPSAGMAGLYTMVDNSVGVFQSPANISFGAVVRPAVNLTNDEQEDLNLPLNGMAVNAIRTFLGKGVLVWGARTLDGNSQDWRYISVRRTVIYIEQSVKQAIEPFVFAPNTASTWTNVKALITNFLTNVWASGALAGASADDAFSVDVGLGTTMTPIDILDGIMRVSVKIAITRPAEFIVITFQQKMQQA
ncbi:MAG: phage tail sheath family protein [Lewinellaceae bacterium]|nr:phage tail sheath family protein [Lewinellaceae bacterium]